MTLIKSKNSLRVAKHELCESLLFGPEAAA